MKTFILKGGLHVLMRSYLLSQCPVFNESLFKLEHTVLSFLG